MEDFIAFGSVCKSWRIAATKENFDVFSPQVPLLMLADKNNDYPEFYSLSKQKVWRMFLPEARGVECFPSQGWIFTAHINTGEMNLLHPFSRTQIPLPSENNLLASQGHGKVLIWSCMDSAILSDSPFLTSNYVLLVSYNGFGSGVAFWRPGDLSWTNITGQFCMTGVNYYKGQFYSVSWLGKVWVFDVAGPQPIEPRLLVQLERDIWSPHSLQFYLVELCGALLLVIRLRDPNYGGYKTLKFEVFELDVTKGELKEEIKTLGESTIFLGRNRPISIDSSKFRGVKPNHIYFTDDLHNQGGRDMGTYNLEDGKIEAFNPGLSLRRICPPTWITPSFL